MFIGIIINRLILTMMKIIKNRYLMMLMMTLCTINATAYDFFADGIYYEINTDNSSVGVTFKDTKYNTYSGDVIIPNSIYGYPVTSINQYAFRDCSNVSIILPNSIVKIGFFAFFNCTGLTHIIIPNSVSFIDMGAFCGCTNLSNLIIPNSVDSIGPGSFAYCTSLISMVIPNSVTSIGWETFYRCTGLTNVTIPNSINEIGLQAFAGCTSLKEITIPNSVTYIGKSAFEGCSGLTIATIGNSVSTIADNVFNRCDALSEIIVANDNPYYDSRDNCNAINETATNLLIVGCKNTIIPNSITKIGNYAFCGCCGLTNVLIPNSITKIGDKAFYDCNGLTSINIPSSIISIGNSAFQGCSSLGTLNYNAVSCADFTSQESNLPFYGLNISTISIGNGVQRIPANFVKDLTTLRTVTIGNSVTTIGNSAFSGCTSMTDVSMGNNITAINDDAFSGCTGLTSITIPNSVRTIGSSAFYGCQNLNSVILPSSLQIMYTKAFYECSGLKTVFSYAATPPVMESSDCFSIYNSATLFVPYHYLDAYKSTYYWNAFYKIYGIDSEGNILVDGIYLDANNINLNVNQTYRFIATVTPDCATNKAVNWNSSNPSVATVGDDGFVTAISSGNTVVTVTTTDGSNLSASCNVSVTSIPVTSISLNQTSLNLDVSDTYQLVASIKPNNATNKTISWSSSNPSVATVSSTGLVTPIAPGAATITATTTDGSNLSASCQVTVVKRVKALALNENSVTLTIPETAQLIATITPEDATIPTLNWSSSNTSVATVDNNGLVTSISAGIAIITATTTDGSNLSASCQVTVNMQYVTSVTLNETTLVMHIGDSFQLIADVQPENASNKTLTWYTGNPSVASVDNNGLVTAISGGTTYVTASATDGSYHSSSCSIKVLPDYYLTLDTLSHIRGMAAQVVDLAVSLINKNLISGIQYDVSLPDSVKFNLINGSPDVWLDDARSTRTHSVSCSQLSNGKYRVLVTSSSSKNLKGNDGELVHMNMLLPQIHNTGDYYIYISNIIASESDETRHILDNTSTKVSFYYIVGDADANAVVDIADHAATASKILGRSPSPFYYNAANVDGNNSLDVVDLVGITNIALEIRPITIRQAPIRGSIENRLFCDKLNLNAEGEREINVGIDCGFDFAGFQMDVKLPEGLSLIDATLHDEATKLGLATEAMPDGSIRLLGTSFSDTEVSGVCPNLLTLKVKADRNYIQGSSIEFTDILFAERNLTSHRFDGSVVEFIEPSSVYELVEEAKIYVENGNIIVDTPCAGTVQIVAIDGRMIEYQAHVGHNVYSVGLNGIYIIQFNGKTIKVRL